MNETTRADIAIIGTGPAGVSAAITARVRGKQVLLFGSKGLTTKMTKAHTIRNYPGLPDITGTDLADKLKHHLDVMGVKITEKQVTTVYAMGSYFGIQTPDIMYEASSVILAGGVVMGKPFPGEDELLGRGVSYCATCDAHFYKGKAVAVLGYNAESCREADFLAETCARVLYFPVVPHEVNVGPNVTVVRERVLSIPGTMRAEGVQTDKDLHPVDGVFVLRDAVAPDKLVPGLATDGPTDAAGGYTDGDTDAALTAHGLTVPAVLADNDAYHALQAVGGLLVTGPTGTNINDVSVVLVQG